MIDHQENEQTGGFNPTFALPDLELLKLFVRESAKPLSNEENNRFKQLIIDTLHPEEKVKDIHALGCKLMLGTMKTPGDFAVGFAEIEDPGERLRYAFRMSRRDKYIQHVGNYYSLGHSAIEQNRLDLLSEHIQWNFESSQEAFNFINRFIDLADNDEGFNIFLGRIMYFLKLRDLEEGIDSPYTIDQGKFARIGMFNFLIFNHMYPSSCAERNRVLEGLDIPPERVPHVSLMNSDLVNVLLEDEPESIELARFIADYFTHFNARPWYN